MSTMKTEQTSNVFGVSNQIVRTYIERPRVDISFKEALKENKHIVIYGSSKQGKTYLLKKHLRENQVVKIECSPKSTTTDLYKSVLRQLDVIFEEGTDRSTVTSVSGSAEASIEAKIPIIVKGTGKVGVGASHQRAKSVRYQKVSFNLDLAQDISEVIRKLRSNKYIVLENFHYLPEDVQKKVAFDIRIFQDYDINFIILGIWRERNRLMQFNGDLQDRLIEIPVEPWSEDDLVKISQIGATFLNVDFSQVNHAIVHAAFDSVGVFQELCKAACTEAGIYQTCNEPFTMKSEHIERAIAKKLADYSTRHTRSLESFCASSKSKSRGGLKPLYIPYNFVKVLLESDFADVVKGLYRPDLHDKIKANHHRPQDVRFSDMSNFLHNIVAYQMSKEINPPLFDYDRSIKTLKIIDSTLYFFLRYCERDVLLEDLGKHLAD
jgi:AAA domain